MNIQNQCCGLVLLFVLLYFYERQKNLHLHTGKAYFQALCIAIVSLTADALSIVAIAYMDRLPLVLVRISCKFYLCTLIVLAFSTVYYIFVDVYTKRSSYKRAIRLNMLIGAAGIPLIIFLPIFIHNDPATESVYTYGPSVITAYVCAVCYLLVNLTTMLVKRKQIAAARQRAVLFWMAIWIGAALIQFIDNKLLIVGFASSVGIMVLYLKLENPEMNIDRQTGLFSQTALFRYMKQLNGQNRNFSLLVMIMEQTFYKNFSQESEEAAELEMIRFLSRLEEGVVFKGSGDEIVLLFENANQALIAGKQIRMRFMKGWGKDDSVIVRPMLIFLPDSTLVREVTDVVHLVKHIRQNSVKLREEAYLEVDEAVISDLYSTRTMEQTIFNAIEKNRITINYQPIYSTEEKKFVSAEALVRITDENGKVIPPYDFIWVAEKNGMMLRLGEIIFEKVCRFIREEQPQQYGIRYIEVNLSAIQCNYEPLADHFIAIMEHYKVPAHMINLEITESAVMGSRKVVRENVRKLLEYGVTFSLDDFGTGESNLNYIVELPVSIVKFDRTMINSYFENGKAKYVMDAAMHMIHGLNLKIVSEGIETEQQMHIMEHLGIGYIQGYYFSKPIGAEEFLNFLKERQ